MRNYVDVTRFEKVVSNHFFYERESDKRRAIGAFCPKCNKSSSFFEWSQQSTDREFRCPVCGQYFTE